MRSSEALIDAVRAGAAATVRTLLAEGADPNARDPAGPLTVLMVAAGRGDVDTVRALLHAGAVVNAVDAAAGASALHKACQGAHLAVVQALVEQGAWIDLQVASTGHTALVEAIWFKSDEIVAFLLDRDARMEPKTSYGFSLDDHINYAIRVGQGQNDSRILGRIQALVAARRDRDRDRQAAAVLVRATLDKDLGALERHLADGADLEARWPIVGSFQDGHTALLVAARDGQTAIVKALLARGANPNAVEPIFGAVPLHKATYNGYRDIAALLAAVRGVNLDYQGPSNGYTPLLDALWHGFSDCALALLDAGARVDIAGYDGKRARDLALEKLAPSDPVLRRL